MLSCQRVCRYNSQSYNRTISKSSVLHAKKGKVKLAESETFADVEQKMNESWKSMQKWKLESSTPTPLVKWLQKIQDKDHSQTLRDVIDNIRQKYPEEAKKADNYVSQLSPGIFSLFNHFHVFSLAEFSFIVFLTIVRLSHRRNAKRIP